MISEQLQTGKMNESDTLTMVIPCMQISNGILITNSRHLQCSPSVCLVDQISDLGKVGEQIQLQTIWYLPICCLEQ